MPQLIWSPASLRDITRLRAFLLLKNPDAARRAIAAIRQGVKLLAAHPEVGRPMPEMPPEFREWPIIFGASSYLALYYLDHQRIVILAVRHSRELGW